MWSTIISYLYLFVVIIISLFGLKSLVLTVLFLLRWRARRNAAPPPPEWPLVAVQLPLYNEKFVAVRLIDTVCAFDYPLDKLEIQVLDDSTDETTTLVHQRVRHYQSLGYNITLYHREARRGYKAGAMAEALEYTSAEYVAIFDADFMPPPDFLKRTIPHFCEDERIGMVEGRWGHLNRQHSLVTRAQALYLDGHLIIEQTARSRNGLLFNFNGSGGVWRTACIRDSGGWLADTLAEDMDLSYRAQLRGWQMRFLPDLVIPAELPHTYTSFKKQQYRWAFGTIQVLIKSFKRLWSEPRLSLVQRINGTLHLATASVHPFVMLMFLVSLPMAMLKAVPPEALGFISLAGFGPIILFAVGQLAGYKDGLTRLLVLPVWILMGVGMAVSNSVAVIRAVLGLPIEWSVTPKYNLNDGVPAAGKSTAKMNSDPLNLAELCMAIYMAFGLGIAIERSPEMVSLMVLGLLSFSYASAISMFETTRPPKQGSTRQVEIA